jgi:DNA-binding MarR family transcriptional regulator
VHLSLTPAGQALREQVGPLKARLLCDSGVDLDRLNDLRNGLDHLLGQIKALS